MSANGTAAAKAIGIDIGGTFTDFIVLDEDGGVTLDKVLSTPADPSRAVLTGLGGLAERSGAELAGYLEGLERLVHGTTVGDNTLIQMNGAVTGLIVTEGFRDELALRRGFKEDIWDVRLPAPPDIVPRRRRLGVRERLSAEGEVLIPLDEESVRRAIRRLKAQGVESVAIVTLFSFVNPEHELRIAELVREEMPDASISLSHEIMPKAPEFERTSTTILNAYIGPQVSGYVDRLQDQLGEVALLLMQSSRGITTRAYMGERPITALASGPVGGVIGCAALGAAKGHRDLLCVDMGGTSYDVSLVRDGQAPSEPGWNWHHRFLVGLPMINVVTLGAGGGSIARVDAGELFVGPESAGADPGPICYGGGGSRPTVTDANLLLGLLSPEATFAGGRMTLATEGVAEAFETQVAAPMGHRDPERAAADVRRLVNANMTQAIRRLTAEKGVDPGGLTMLAYGGNGPVHACVQAEDLGISRIIVPRQSPAFSALGLLAADPLIDEERSYLVASDAADLERIRGLWSELSRRAVEHFARAGFDSGALAFERQLNFRYSGQNWSLTVTVDAEPGDAPFEARGFAAALEAFHDLHEREHTYARRDEVPELTGVRLVATAPVDHPPFSANGAAGRGAEGSQRRRANLGEGFVEVEVHHGPSLEVGAELSGPAIIEEDFTTIVVNPGWRAVVDAGGDYLLERSGAE